MREPLVTIGITSYREGDWLRECWESVLAQDDDRWEAVLVQDAGADAASRSAFDQISHPKLRKHRMTKRGFNSGTRNQAFAMTRTPYHFYLDGDDCLKPWSVRRAVETFAANPEAAFVYGDLQLFGRVNRVQRQPRTYSLEDWARRQVVSGPAVYRRDLWEEVGGFVATPGEVEALLYNNDYDFHLSLAERGYRGVHCGDVLLAYRVHGKEQISWEPGMAEVLYKTYPLMMRRHPSFFASSARRRTFGAAGFYGSWRTLVGRGDADGARRVAAEALTTLGWSDLVRVGPHGRRMLLSAWLPRPLWRILVARRYRRTT